MRTAAGRLLALSAVLLATLIAQAQSGAADPRVGLKPGFRDAGEAARNMERVASLPKPEGFFDPKAPAGPPTAPERTATAAGGAANGPGTATPPPGAAPAAAEPARDNNEPADADGTTRPAANTAASNALGYANSDIAFSGNLAFVGSYHGFNIYDIEIARSRG